MMEKILMILILLTSLTGVCPWRTRQTYVRAGEMVALYCRHDRRSSHGDAKVIWTSSSSQERDLADMSSAEQTQMGLLVRGRSLVILSASVNHQGNYSCFPGSRLWFSLIVCTTQSRECEERTQYPHICYRQEACTLNCPEVNIPAVSITNITSNGIIWNKEGEPKDGYFSSVEENDHGVYTCTRSYLYRRQEYHMTFTVVLQVKPKGKFGQAMILSPCRNGVLKVYLGATLVVDCKAVMYSDFDDVLWFDGKSEVETNNSFPVFYNYTREGNAAEIKMTASLVFKKVSEEDLSKTYTCRLDAVSGPSSFVTITLAQKDGKSYDAFVMCYKSDTDAGLNEDDRKCLESALEERFGYTLCLYDRDVSPGKAAAEAVLDCIEQSRAVVLVPTSPDPGPGSGLLSAIHAALVERQTRLIFIQTETTEAPRSGSLPEALQLLGEAGDCVTWKGMSSMPHSSSFWKQLRYHLPAPREASNVKLLP
ncbi:interleukin-18 receptor accessory protein-like isoform X3 [Pseudoliparis swirei]|uniref:interleukin-18 receptor accessory protein-like isoform X3 n=1 Tax=Pseudoliparis swirei TaxID=2059687 RepID=UPI0024BDC1A1|nr:interleukin-18 receptor accessory protein-like isoform X3 [Pseudoliparis swirei]